MKAHRVLIASLALALSACATTSADVRSGTDLGEIFVDTVRTHHRANRAAIRGALASLGDAVGYRRGRVIDRRIVESDVTALPEAPFDARPTRRLAPDRDPPPQSGERILRSFRMEVEVDEMLTPEGSLHDSAARTLANIDDMVRDQGGDFSVFVPRSRMPSSAAIRAVAPGARIFASDADEHYRLIVVSPDR